MSEYGEAVQYAMHSDRIVSTVMVEKKHYRMPIQVLFDPSISPIVCYRKISGRENSPSNAYLKYSYSWMDIYHPLFSEKAIIPYLYTWLAIELTGIYLVVKTCAYFSRKC